MSVPERHRDGAAGLAAYERRLFARASPDSGPERAWRDRAACRNAADPEIFFDINPRSAVTAHALSFCARCEVTSRCLAYAVVNGCWGVWGGVYRPAPDTAAFRRGREAA